NADSGFSYSGHKSYLLKGGNNFIPETIIKVDGSRKGWYRASAKVYIATWEYDNNKQPYLYICMESDSVELRRQAYRIMRVTEPGKWEEVSIDIQTPQNDKFNRLKVGIGNKHGDKAV